MESSLSKSGGGLKERIDGITVIASLVCGPAFILFLFCLFAEGTVGKITAAALVCLCVTCRANLIVARWGKKRGKS